jgi:pilus assembly protein CpaE
MHPDIRVLLAVDLEIDRGPIEQLIQAQPGLELVGVVDDDRTWVESGRTAADVLIIACASTTDAAIDLVAEATAERPDRPVIVVCSDSPNGLVRRAFEAGADDIVQASDVLARPDELHFAIRKALTRRATPVAAARSEGGDLVCVLGPKGGTGKTLTSTNLSVALAQEGLRVAVVDLDLQFGDIGLVLGVKPERSIYELVTAGGSLDASKLEAFLTPHASGVQLLLAPARPDHASVVTNKFLTELFPVMRSMFDVVVVDTPPGFTPEVIAAIDCSSAVVLLATLDTPSLKNAKLGAETLELMGYPRDRIRVVLNRADSSVGVSHADVVTVLGRAPDVLIPSNREIVRSVNTGEPIVLSNPRSEAAKGFSALARLVRGSHDTPAVLPVAVPERIGRRRLRVLGRS